MAGLVDWLATIGYPVLASLCLFWIFFFVAEFRATKQKRILLVVGALLCAFVAFAIVSVSTGVYVIVSFADAAFLVRGMWLLAGVLGWLYTFHFVIFQRFLDQW